MIAACALSLAPLLTSASHARTERLDFGSTFAVVAGILEWEDPDLSPFPNDNRKDKEPFELLGRLGVPRAQRSLLLDTNTTASAIEIALEQVIAKAPSTRPWSSEDHRRSRGSNWRGSFSTTVVMRRSDDHGGTETRRGHGEFSVRERDA